MLAIARDFLVKQIDVPGIILQMPIVSPAGDLVARVAESQTEDSVGVCRFAPDKRRGAFILIDFRVAIQLQQLGVELAQLIRYRSELNVNNAPSLRKISGWEDDTSCPCP